MDTRELLGTSFSCDCGKRHSIPIEKFVYGEDAFAAIPDTVKALIPGGRCLLVADARTFDAAGEPVENALKTAGVPVQRFIVADPPRGTPVTDDHTKDFLLEHADAADLYVAVGSGVINDLVKWMAHLRDTPYISVATAASMNGYGSANVAATVDGLKVLFQARAPRAVFADPTVIMGAPHELSTAGLGDVLAKPVSSADWKLNQFLFHDYYCQFSVDLLKDLEPVYLEHPERIGNREPEGFAALFRALFLSSIAMTITGTSAPASGGEHLISHTLDIIADRDGVEHDLHGRQVGVGSILAAALYEAVLAVEQPTFMPFPEEIDSSFWGSLSPIVRQEYAKKLPKLYRAREVLSDPAAWQELRSMLATHLVAPRALKHCLERAGGAHAFPQIRRNRMPLDRETFLSTVTRANQMRDRFTILDLAVLLGIVPDRLEPLVDTWVAA